jgi:hypothetical protein
MNQFGFCWRCPACGDELPDLQLLPSVVAIPLDDARAETHPVMRLHRLCDAFEILSRFCTILALSELRVQLGESPLPQSLLRRIQPQIERPTWGQWLGMLEAVVAELAGRSPVILPGLAGFVRDEVLPLTPAGDDPETSLLSLRNLLAHGGTMRSVHADAFLAVWEPRLANVLSDLSFLAGAKLYHFALGVAHELAGPMPHTGWPARSVAELLPGRDASELEGHVVLLRDEALLDLWPLCDHDRAKMRGASRPRLATEPGPLLYLRAERDRLLYAALGVDLPLGEKSDGLETFRSLFRLDERLDVSRAIGGDFETEIRMDSAALVGRASELKQAKDMLKAAQTGVFWLGGPGGIGKSFLAARLAHDYGNDPERVCRIAWRFKIADQNRGNRVAFLRHAVSKLAAWKHLSKTSLPLSFESDKLLDQLRALLDEVALLAPRSERERPPRVIFILDGLDEIMRLDEGFLFLPFQLSRPNVVWLCAGRPEGLGDVFAPDRCTHLFVGGLPRMSPEDIRGMLLDSTGNLKYDLLYLDQEQSERVTNEAVQAVVARAAGLPLYVHFVIEDILSGHFAFEQLASELPPSLSAYYAELLRRVQISSLQALVTPLIVTIAWAKAPLDEEALHLLMLRRKVLDNSEAGRGLLRQGLETLQGMIRLAPLPNTDFLGYELYHPTFREHIHSDPHGTLATQNQLARRELCMLIREWSSIPESHPAQTYVFRHGVSHILEESDLEGVRYAVRSEFLIARANKIDNPIGFVDAHRMAKSLADAGDEYWDDLVRCAFQYCTLAERMRTHAFALEELIRDERWEEVESVLDAETNTERSALLRLATSELCLHYGHHHRGREFRAQADPVLPSILRPKSTEHNCPELLRRLAKAVVEGSSAKIPPLDQESVRMPSTAIAHSLTKVAPSTVVPFNIFLLIRLSATGTGIFLFWGGPAWGLVCKWVGLFGDSDQSDMYAGISTLVIMITGVLVPIFASVLLKRQQGNLVDIMRRFEVAYHHCANDGRHLLVIRALRFNALLFDASLDPLEFPVKKQRVDHDQVEIPVARILSHYLSVCPIEATEETLLLAASGGDRMHEALTGMLLSMNPNRRDWALRASVRDTVRTTYANWSRFLTLVQGLRMCVPVPPEALAVGVVRGVPSEARLNSVLALLPRHELAQLLLNVLSADHHRNRNSKPFLGISDDPSISPRERWATWVYLLLMALPMAMVCVFLLTVVAPVAYLLVLLSLFVFVPLLVWVPIACSSWDPYGLSRLAGLPVQDVRTRLFHSLVKLEAINFLYAPPFLLKRICNFLLLCDLLETEQYGQPMAVHKWPYRLLLRSFFALKRSRKIGRRLDLVLACMSDRRLLRIVVSLPESTQTSGGHWTLDAPEVANQLIRTLPPTPKLASFLWTAGVSLLGIALWSTGFGAARSLDVTDATQNYAITYLPVVSFVLLLNQYWDNSRQMGCGKTIMRLTWHLVTIVSPLIVALILFPGLGLSAPSMYVVVLTGTSLLITRVMAPEVVAQWRGANLLLPSPRRLLLQRSLLIVYIVVILPILGAVTSPALHQDNVQIVPPILTVALCLVASKAWARWSADAFRIR